MPGVVVTHDINTNPETEAQIFQVCTVNDEVIPPLSVRKVVCSFRAAVNQRLNVISSDVMVRPSSIKGNESVEVYKGYHSVHFGQNTGVLMVNKTKKVGTNIFTNYYCGSFVSTAEGGDSV